MNISITRKTGIVQDYDKEAVKDIFVGKDVIGLILELENGSMTTVRYIIDAGLELHWSLWNIFNGSMGSNYVTGAKILEIDTLAVTKEFRQFSNDPYMLISGLPLEYKHHMMQVLFRPAIGDTVCIGWDYGQMKGEIIKFGENRQPIPRDIPVVSSRSLHAGDVSDSLK